MSRARAIRYWCCLGLAFVGCRDPELTLRDSEGRVFAARCAEAGGTCSLRQLGGPVARAGFSPVLRARGRYVGVCDSQADAPLHPGDCRPLRCQSDGDCPPLHGPGTGACVGRACVEPAQALSVEDAVLLCLAETGLGHESARQVERYALAQNCGEPCQIPAPCRTAAAP